MAYADLAQFLPQEGGFKRPGEFDRMLKAEASKRAGYLSAMDQFYAQLEESGRQFDLDFSQRRREFDKMMDLRNSLRNIEYGKLGVSAAGVGTQLFLGDKGITYGYEKIEDWIEQMGGWKALLGFGGEEGGGNMDWLFENLDFDLGDFDLDLYGDAGESLLDFSGDVWEDLGDMF